MSEAEPKKYVVVERYNHLITYHVWARSKDEAEWIVNNAENLSDEVGNEMTHVRTDATLYVDPKKEGANG